MLRLGRGPCAALALLVLARGGATAQEAACTVPDGHRWYCSSARCKQVVTWFTDVAYDEADGFGCSFFQLDAVLALSTDYAKLCDAPTGEPSIDQTVLSLSSFFMTVLSDSELGQAHVNRFVPQYCPTTCAKPCAAAPVDGVWFEAATDVGCVGDAVSDDYTATLTQCKSRAEEYDGAAAIEW